VAIGLGGAGFTMMGTVYIFNAKRYRQIIRPVVLMAFLAYASASFSLFIDIGRSWAIWHPIVMWNPHSVLFEVAWCLMLYTCVLLLEGSGMLFERWGWDRMVKIQHAVTLPIVIVGVVLSTLHQSSLGALFLIVPGKLHGLWYTEMLPALFLMSAICMGLAMVIVLSRLSAKAFGRHLETHVLGGLARILVALLWVYGIVRVFDLAVNGRLALVANFNYESMMFLLEFALGVLLPAALLSFSRIRKHPTGLYASSLLVVFGFVLNRLNVSITGFEYAQGGHYVPAWGEIFVTLMIVAGVFGVYALGVRYLDVYPEVTARLRGKAAPASPVPDALPNGFDVGPAPHELAAWERRIRDVPR
jgi:Ni/Fe-hydrogenase subunit HybB-like protein